ncbi:MAG: hypothetical protein HMLKMBBP_02959 [Planctomycetes bacterium]|nr:hypothetical protein [Planctomycetota bacterium]
MSATAASETRIAVLNGAPVRPGRRHVLYWMTAARRTRRNWGLQRAVAAARRFGRPLVVLEAIRAGAPWASARTHRFVIDGMRDQAARFGAAGVAYHPYVEPRHGHGRGLVERLAADACLVVADQFPAFFVPRMLASAASRLDVKLEAVDSCGLLPLRSAPRAFQTAMAFRRFAQGELPSALAEQPKEDPLAGPPLPAGAVPDDVAARWPAADARLLEGDPSALASIAVDHGVPPAPVTGGERAAQRLVASLPGKLARYEDRNHPDEGATSGLAPYLHFGHVSPADVFAAVAASSGWTAPETWPRPTGRREGWWGMPPAAEGFLDQIVTWRELGYSASHRLGADFERFESLPAWALATLGKHRGDARRHVYGRDALERAETHDPVWNAAQRELRETGTMHNYLRMLWGKKVIEWSRTPEEAFDALVHLNNRWAVDGRDPNSWSGISWCFGRFDRPWGPERPVFGTVRWMSSEAALRKIRMKEWLRRYGREGVAS